MPLSYFLTKSIWWCVLPLVLLSFLLAIQYIRTLNTVGHERAADKAIDFAITIDEHLKTRIAALQMLAVSSLVDDSSRRAELYREAQAFHQSLGGHVILVDVSMQMFLNTGVPFGDALPKLPKPNSDCAVTAVVETGKPAIGDLLPGSVAENPLIAVVVPVLRSGETRFLLINTLESNHFQQRLGEVELPGGWSLALVDGKDKAIAHRSSPQMIRRPVTEKFSGRWIVPIALSSWSVVLDIPRTIYYRPVIIASAALVLAILAITLMSVIVGRSAGRQLTGSLTSLVESVPNAAARPAIAEIESVRRILTETAIAQQVAESTLRESEQRFRLLVEYAPDAIYIQTEGRFAYLNQAAVYLFGADHKDDLIGKSVVERVHPAFQESIRERMRQLNQGRGVIPRQVEICMLRLDNTSVNVETSAVPFEYGGQNGALVFVRDMTEFHQAQLRHQELESQLYQAQKMEAVGRLAGGVAHDFNNLLAIVLGYVELMLEDAKVKRAHREHLETIYNAAKRASDLTRQLLAFSRKQILEMKTASVNAIITGFEKLLRRLIGEDIKLELSLNPENPLVRADTAQMEQVLMNLAVNARDAMPDGGVLTIKTSMEEISAARAEQVPGMKAGSYAMIEVGDTGCGMDQETLMNIFEPFFTTKGKEKGTGLGLATSYGIIKQHGGYIAGDSEPGKGATFKIYLPLVTGSVVTEEKVIQEAEPVSSATTVLVVEDDPAVRSLVCTLLREAGYRVIEADSPENALSLAVDQESNIHLVLTDVVMPGMKGPEVYEKIRGSHPEAKVLYMSGYTDEVIVHHGVLIEGIDFIHKPFTTRKLLNKVSKVLHEA